MPNNNPVTIIGVDPTCQFAITGAGSGGTSSAFGAALPASGTAAGFRDNSGNMAAGNLDASGNLKVSGSLSTTPPAAATAVISTVTSSAVSQTALSANANRLGVVYSNGADKICYLKYGVTASASSFTKKLLPTEQWEPQMNYTGRVDVIWDAGPTGSLVITELTA